VERTRELFAAGRALICRMPPALAVDVDLFSRGGLAILNRIEVQGYDVLTRRPRLSKSAKLGLLARALVGRCWPLSRPATAAVPSPLAGEG